MSVPKAKALLTVCAALLLCGCGQALSEREIVRAVFFARQQGAYSACLLLADQNAESDGVQYKTASARGDTAAQALHLFVDGVSILCKDVFVHAANPAHFFAILLPPRRNACVPGAHLYGEHGVDAVVQPGWHQAVYPAVTVH